MAKRWESWGVKTPYGILTHSEWSREQARDIAAGHDTKPSRVRITEIPRRRKK